MFSSRDILLGLLLPLLITSAWIAIIRRFAALAIAAGFVVGNIAVFGWPGWRPGNAFQWLPLLVASASILAELPIPRWPRWVGALIFAVIALWLVVGPRADAQWWWILLLAIGGWLWWAQWDALVTRSPGPWTGAVMTGVAGFTSLVLLLSSSQVIGQMGMALLAAVMGGWFAGFWRGGRWDLMSIPWSVAIYFLVVSGVFWAELTPVNAVLLLLAPTFAWLAELPPVRTLTGWKLSVVRIAVVLIPVLVATGMAGVEFKRAQESPGSEYY